jgi:hypothetical protein
MKRAVRLEFMAMHIVQNAASEVIEQAIRKDLYINFSLSRLGKETDR